MNDKLINEVHHQNCLIGMKQIADKSIDMILCDLPFGTTCNDWDKIIDFKLLWNEYERIIKDNGAILLFAQSPFDKILAMSNIKLLRYEWIWEKSSATGFFNADKMPMKAHENILVFYKKLPTFNPIKTKGKKKVSRASHKINCEASSNYGKQLHTKDYESDERYPRSVLFYPKDAKKIEGFKKSHPTRKPVALCEYFIETYTNEGDVVLDNCVGSGTTAVACINKKRNFIAYETDEYFVKMTNYRIKLAKGEVGLYSNE